MTEQQWTGVVAVLGEDSGDGRFLNGEWTLRGGGPVPLKTIGLLPRIIGTVDRMETTPDGLLRCWGTVWEEASAMFGERMVWPAVELDGPPPVVDAEAGTMTWPSGGTVVAVAVVEHPSWAGRVYFEPVVGAAVGEGTP